MSDYPNYRGLKIIAHPAKSGPGIFVVTFHNVGEKWLWNVRFDTYPIFGPIAFGLDDTHMPSSVIHDQVIRIDSLAPGTTYETQLRLWGDLSKYRGKEQISALVRVDNRQKDGTTYGIHAELSIPS